MSIQRSYAFSSSVVDLGETRTNIRSIDYRHRYIHRQSRTRSGTCLCRQSIYQLDKAVQRNVRVTRPNMLAYNNYIKP